MKLNPFSMPKFRFLILFCALLLGVFVLGGSHAKAYESFPASGNITGVRVYHCTTNSNPNSDWNSFLSKNTGSNGTEGIYVNCESRSKSSIGATIVWGTTNSDPGMKAEVSKDQNFLTGITSILEISSSLHSGTEHEAKFTGLTPSTTYYFRIKPSVGSTVVYNGSFKTDYGEIYLFGKQGGLVNIQLKFNGSTLVWTGYPCGTDNEYVSGTAPYALVNRSSGEIQVCNGSVFSNYYSFSATVRQNDANSPYLVSIPSDTVYAPDPAPLSYSITPNSYASPYIYTVPQGSSVSIPIVYKTNTPSDATTAATITPSTSIVKANGMLGLPSGISIAYSPTSCVLPPSPAATCGINLVVDATTTATTGSYQIVRRIGFGSFTTDVPYFTLNVVSPSTTTLTASPTSVSVGGTTALTWTSNGTSCDATGGWTGTKTANGSQVVTPTLASTTYTLSCTGAGGTSSPVSATVTLNYPSLSVFLSDASGVAIPGVANLSSSWVKGTSLPPSLYFTIKNGSSGAILNYRTSVTGDSSFLAGGAGGIPSGGTLTGTGDTNSFQVVTANFLPSSATSVGTHTATVTVSDNNPVVANRVASKTIAITLTVTDSFDFSVTAPSLLSVVQGNSAGGNVTITKIKGSATATSASASTVASSQGPRSPSASVSKGCDVVQRPWTSPQDVTSSDDIYATVAVPNGQRSDCNYSSGFGFSIPSNATITGIKIEAEIRGPSGTFSYLQSQPTKNGSLAGSLQNSTLSSSPSVENYYAVGNSSDLWIQSWTPAEINSFSFGILIRVLNSTGFQGTYSLDHARVTVHYTAPAPVSASTGAGVNISLAVMGLPAGVTAAFSPTPCALAVSTCTSALTLTAGADAVAGVKTITITASKPADATGPAMSHTKTFSLTVSKSFGISLTLLPTSLDITQGRTGSARVLATITAQSGKSAKFSAGGLPSGAAATFSPALCTTTCSSNISISSGSAVPGTSAITINATDTGGKIVSALLTLNIKALATPTPTATAIPVVTATPRPTTQPGETPKPLKFSLVTVKTLSVIQGSLTNTSVILSYASGDSKTARISISGAPEGVTASLSKESCEPNCYVILTISASKNAKLGNSNLIVKAESSSDTKTSPIELIVGTNPPNLPVSLNQYQLGGEVISAGSTIKDDKLVFKGILASAEGSNVRLRVEVKPVGEFFDGVTGVTEDTSKNVPSGGEYDLKGSGFSGGFKWRAQAVDAKGIASQWADFAASDDSPDFITDLTAPPPNPFLANQGEKPQVEQPGFFSRWFGWTCKVPGVRYFCK